MGFDSKQTAAAQTGPARTERMMQAIVQDSYGSADVLRSAQIERPVIADNEVLVRVHAAGLDRGTWHLMTGTPYLMRIMGFGFRGPKNRVPGVDVAGKTIRIAVLVFGDVVYKTECFQLQVFFMHFDTCLFIPILFQDVMVAFDQANVDIGKVISPSPEEGQLVVLAAVKKISYDEQLQGLKILYLRQQPMKVLFIDGGWHRDTGFTKMSCFAKMKIGEDERFFFFPKDTTFRR